MYDINTCTRRLELTRDAKIRDKMDLTADVEMAKALERLVKRLEKDVQAPERVESMGQP